MTITTKPTRLTKSLTLCGMAALMLGTAAIGVESIMLTPAFAAGQGSGGSDSSGGGSGGGSRDDSGGTRAGSGSGGDDGQGQSSGGTGGSDNEPARAPSAGTGGTQGSTSSQGGGAQQQSGGGSTNASNSTGAQQGDAPGGQAMGKPEDRTMTALFLDLTGEEEDSDRPDWSGEPGGKDGAGGGQPDTSGTTKGDLFGDLWVILRDDNGVPILTPEGWPQPLDADGNLIALDEEGHPIDESATIEVELGRLNVARAPVSVLDNRAHEVIDLMNSADALSTDAAGRLVFTVDGIDKTIDSPLENLAIYVALMTTGTIPGVADLPGTDFDFMVDGTFTVDDLEASAAFLAAATDKSGVFTSDEIAYLNAFLNVNTVSDGAVTYADIDFTDFTYSRTDSYAGVTAEVLVLQEDGSWMPTVVDIYEEVFGSETADTGGTLVAYTQAADDARSVVNFIHEYEVPAVDLAQVTH